ncbi:NADPH dehydrogenase afvA [Penicillium angulare]|uniref:NADPH dehydrogenase afvA n=1 Tax=Penicillium angulare TaxID=116970 RepID=UPI0025400283|nr:NADPH dehydrogenase afvA [Penicillium angulare]KAJ5280183.1 NADPH dehydrogenase afvA [Penicillium angulare]
MIIEATGVLPEGCITPGCLGLWKDSQVGPHKQIVDFAHSQVQKIGIQFGHAGRKASTLPRWVGGATATNAVAGWVENIKSASAIPFSDNDIVRKAMTSEDIQDLKEAWVPAAQRALSAGVDFIEIYAAHGYLLSSFLSASSNQRVGQYGGTFETRIRLPLEIARLTRDTVGPKMPVFLRVSGTDWLDNHPQDQGWSLDDTVKFAVALADEGSVDLIDISSGGVHSAQEITSGPAFQVPFAAKVKQAVGDRLLGSRM